MQKAPANELRYAPWNNALGVVSLKGLLAYAAEVFCLLTDALGRVYAQPWGLVGAAMGNDGYRQDFMVKLAAARDLCTKHKWKETAYQISQVGEYMDDPNFTPLVLQAKCADLEKHLMRMLGERLFFHADDERLKEWSKSSKACQDWKFAFPRAYIELVGARQCYLFGQANASVFHSMRALEIGLTAFAKKLKVVVGRDQWEVIINNIESEVKKINGPAAGRDWKRRQEQYSEAALHFRYLKNAWRNHVMHVRYIYELPKAFQILEHVSEFIDALRIIGLREPGASRFVESWK